MSIANRDTIGMVRSCVLLLAVGCSTPAEPDFVELVTPERMLEPGLEAIYCYYVDNVSGRFGTDAVETVQGPGGHHVAFRRATERRPDGTVEECTSGEDQATRGLGDFFVGGTLPGGWAIEIPSDAQFVIESHYQNSTDQPLVVRDVVRVHRVEVSDVTRWVNTMHLRTYDAVVMPAITRRSFDCAIANDLELFEFWGHQHATGTEVDVELTAPGQPAATIYSAHWGLDEAIVDLTTTPLLVAAGSQLRVSCTWNNPTVQPIRYPDEMCAFGGYVAATELSCIAPSYAR